MGYVEYKGVRAGTHCSGNGLKFFFLMENLESDQISSNIITALKMSTVVVILLLRRKIVLKIRGFLGL